MSPYLHSENVPPVGSCGVPKQDRPGLPCLYTVIIFPLSAIKILDLTKSLRYVCNRYERLVLRHEEGNRAEPYVYGTLLSARKVGSFIGLVKGWEGILEL